MSPTPLRPLVTMVRVVLKKIWEDREGGPPMGRELVGNMIRRPVVGRGLVVFLDPKGTALHRLNRVVTAPVRRVHGSRNNFYVETENSIYRLTIGEAILRGRREPTPPFGLNIQTAEAA